MASAFEQTINLALRQFSPEEAKRRHIAIARAGIARFLSGENPPPDYTIFVDGQQASSESSVKPFGVIEYRLTRLKQIALFALAEARRLSPRSSSDSKAHYQDKWFFMDVKSEISVEQIGNRSFTLLNDQPYSRKIHVGARGFEAHRGIVEKIRQAVQRRFGNQVTTEISFLNLEGGWVLRKGLRHIREGRRYGGVRRDASAGMQITYPALIVTARR